MGGDEVKAMRRPVLPSVTASTFIFSCYLEFLKLFDFLLFLHPVDVLQCYSVASSNATSI